MRPPRFALAEDLLLLPHPAEALTCLPPHMPTFLQTRFSSLWRNEERGAWVLAGVYSRVEGAQLKAGESSSQFIIQHVVWELSGCLTRSTADK